MYSEEDILLVLTSPKSKAYPRSSFSLKTYPLRNITNVPDKKLEIFMMLDISLLLHRALSLKEQLVLLKQNIQMLGGDLSII